MKTLIAGHTQEGIVRHYLEAFVACDVNSMLEHVHPAVHYECYVKGRQSKLINGSESFKHYLLDGITQVNDHSFELTKLKSDRDRVEVAFSITPGSLAAVEGDHFSGRASFWFMEGQIFQIVVEVM